MEYKRHATSAANNSGQLAAVLENECTQAFADPLVVWRDEPQGLGARPPVACHAAGTRLPVTVYSGDARVP